MRILINAASAHMGGAATYAKNMVQWFPRIAPRDEFFMVVPAETKARLEAVRSPVHLIAYPFSRTNGVSRLYFDQVVTARLASQINADLLYSTTGFGTLQPPCPQVLLVRNLAYFDPAFRQRYHVLGRSLRKNTVRRWHSLVSIIAADKVFFPTRAMLDLVALDVPRRRDRLAVNHYGFDASAFQRPDHVPAWIEMIERFKHDDYHILLNVSTFAVQKNFETLVEALPLILESGLRVKLLVTMSRDRTSDVREYDALFDRAKQLGVDEDIIELGYVPHEQLGALYRSADLYVFPSFTESFGHTMVEAMASGLPVVASETPTNREVCADAGRFFGTFNPAACAESIVDILRTRAVMDRMIASSLRRAAAFSWERHFGTLMEAFSSLVTTRTLEHARYAQ